ncbi:MAG: aconitase X swivel domain-containing protein [Acidobacteriota bacterium]
MTVVRGRVLAAGAASGEALVLDEPLSLWGGIDPASGLIIDVHHPQHGANVRGRIVVMPGGRGSSSSSSVLAEAVRLGTAPAAILLGEVDLILAIGAAVASELYGRALPIVQLDPPHLAAIPEGARLAIDLDGAVRALEDEDHWTLSRQGAQPTM